MNLRNSTKYLTSMAPSSSSTQQILMTASTETAAVRHTSALILFHLSMPYGFLPTTTSALLHGQIWKEQPLRLSPSATLTSCHPQTIIPLGTGSVHTFRQDPYSGPQWFQPHKPCATHCSSCSSLPAAAMLSASFFITSACLQGWMEAAFTDRWG